MDNFSVYRIAGIDFAIRCADQYFKEYCKGYESDGNPTEFIEVTNADIDEECSTCKKEEAVSEKTFRSRACLTRLYRKIVDKVIDKGGFFLHSAVIEYRGTAFCFIAPSGTGKSTHIKLWKKILPQEVGIVNGDKPIIMPDKNGGFSAYGTPWAGKEGWQRNISVPLGAICSLYRSEIPTAKKIDPIEAFSVIMSATVIPSEKEKLDIFLDSIDRLVCSVPAFSIGCNVNAESAILSFETITGEKYTGEKYTDNTQHS